MFGQVLKQWFWDIYDHLGRLVALNVMLCVLFIPVLFGVAGLYLYLLGGLGPAGAALVAIALGCLLVPILGTPWLAGMLGFGAMVSEEKDPSFRDYFRRIRLHGSSVFRFLLVAAAAGAVLLLNMWFYLYAEPVESWPWLIRAVLGGLVVWLLLALFAIVMLGLPLVVKEGYDLRRAVLGAVYRILKYPILTLTAVFFLLSLNAVLAVIKLAGTLVFALAATAMFANSLHDVIRDQETEESAARERSQEPTSRPASWKDIREQESVSEEVAMRRKRYDRTFADALKPWEG